MVLVLLWNKANSLKNIGITRRSELTSHAMYEGLNLPIAGYFSIIKLRFNFLVDTFGYELRMSILLIIPVYSKHEFAHFL